MGIVRAIIGLLLAALFVAFAIANRHSVELFWNPAASAINIPLYIVVLGPLALGFLVGGFVTSFSSLKLRLEKSKQKRRITVLEKELDGLKSTTSTDLAKQDQAA